MRNKTPDSIPTGLITTLQRRLLAAYDEGKRELPWRKETDPYRIWVSEVMLQQTRVETVIPYYEKWVERFPTLSALADAEEDEVLRIWQGLGYYSRARRLHHGAQVVKEQHGGSLPPTHEGLRELPGVGDYTAGAVASIAFGQAVPAVDGNVRRVLTRLFDMANPSPGDLRELAGALVDPRRPGDFNQALMELGAVVCLPRNPRCEECPVGSECQAFERGTVAERPRPKERKSVPEKDVAVLVLTALGHSDSPQVLLRKRPNAGLLAGMWECPSVELPLSGRSAEPAIEEPAVAEVFRAALEEIPLVLPDLDVEAPATALKTVVHQFSHMRVRYRSVLVRLPALPESIVKPESELGSEPYRWVPMEALDRVPLPVAQQKILERAGNRLGL